MRCFSRISFVPCYQFQFTKVSSGEWDKDSSQEDRKQKDAMTARGYFQAFQEVKKSLEKILKGENAGLQADKDHQKWYRELFDPSIQAGILKASDLAGYRSHQVYISSSKHVPLSVEAMRDAMPELFDLLQKEQHPAVRAVLGHYIFVFIHPYMDGNGRIGRFLMNTMLASGGYPFLSLAVNLSQLIIFFQLVRLALLQSIQAQVLHRV